jgi:hypothetical protein
MELIKPHEPEGVVAEAICERAIQTIGGLLESSSSNFLQGSNLKSLLHFLIISGELDSIINAFYGNGNGQGGLFPTL